MYSIIEGKRINLTRILDNLSSWFWLSNL